MILSSKPADANNRSISIVAQALPSLHVAVSTERACVIWKVATISMSFSASRSTGFNSPPPRMLWWTLTSKSTPRSFAVLASRSLRTSGSAFVRSSVLTPVLCYIYVSARSPGGTLTVNEHTSPKCASNRHFVRLVACSRRSRLRPTRLLHHMVGSAGETGLSRDDALLRYMACTPVLEWRVHPNRLR